MLGRTPVLLLPLRLPFLFPYPSLPFSSPSLLFSVLLFPLSPLSPFFSPPLPLEVGPFIVARESGQGNTFLTQRVRQSTAAEQYLVNFRLKVSPLVAIIIRSFSGNET